MNEHQPVKTEPGQDRTHGVCPKDISDVTISFGGSIIHDAPFVKNLGAYFDRTLCMEKQCNAVTRSCFLNIRNIGRIRPYISEDACKTPVNSRLTSRLDYSNALLYGVNKQLTNCQEHRMQLLVL